MKYHQLSNSIKIKKINFRCVEPEYASIAGMFGSASIVTGIIAGIGCSYLMPNLISMEALDFDQPEWWPAYKW